MGRGSRRLWTKGIGTHVPISPRLYSPPRLKKTGTRASRPWPRISVTHAGSMRRPPGAESLHKSEYPKLAADDIIANMSTLELSDEQVISLVRGLPAERKRAALLALAQEAQAGREDRLRLGEAQLRRASAERGLDWDRLSEDERESFVDALLHEK